MKRLLLALALLGPLFTLNAAKTADPFELEKAPAAPTLAEGGFAPEPAFAEDFNPDWNDNHPAWAIATWKQNGTLMSPERARVADGYFVQTVLAGTPFRGGSIETKGEFGWGRWVARVKPSAVPGVLNSIFTKDWDDRTTEKGSDGLKGEVDIEFLTETFGEGKGQVHLAIHLLNDHPLWALNIPLDFNPSDEFMLWGFDILPDRVVWHVEGKVLHTWEYTDEHFIHPNYEFFMNSWTNVKWIKGPPEEDADYLVDWVRFYPLTE